MRLWHELPPRWNGEVAAQLYRGPIREALKAHRGEKRHYLLLEDNALAGYKSRKGRSAKQDIGVCPLRFPKYSPDLNPLDFYIWAEVERRALLLCASRAVSAKAYRVHLQRVALGFLRAPTDGCE